MPIKSIYNPLKIQSILYIEWKRPHFSNFLKKININKFNWIFRFTAFVVLVLFALYSCEKNSIFLYLQVPFQAIMYISLVLGIEAEASKEFIKEDHIRKFSKWLTARLDFIYVNLGIASAIILFIQSEGAKIYPFVLLTSKFSLVSAFSLRSAKSFIDLRESPSPFASRDQSNKRIVISDYISVDTSCSDPGTKNRHEPSN